MRAQFTFFHQGYDLLKENDPFMRQVATEVDRLRKEAEVNIRSMDDRHSLVTPQHLQVASHGDTQMLVLHFFFEAAVSSEMDHNKVNPDYSRVKH